MNFKQKIATVLASISLEATPFVAAKNILLNTSFDASREFYKDDNAVFVAVK